MKNLNFPAYRIVQDVTPDSQLGEYPQELWDKVLKDIFQAIDENTEAYDECEERIYHVK